MIYLALADATVILHLAFVLFAVLGGLLVWRWPGLAWLHVPAVLWGAWIELAGAICPLTPLENRLREAGGGSPYEQGFVEQYLVPVLYPDLETRELRWLLGALLLSVNAVVYFLLPRRR